MTAVPKTPDFSKMQKDVFKIKKELEKMLTLMKQEPDFTPTRNQLETLAERLIDLINKNPLKKTAEEQAIKSAVEKYLKAAIIDLTEIPEMSPQMQRISFITAIKDAVRNLDLFIG